MAWDNGSNNFGGGGGGHMGSSQGGADGERSSGKEALRPVTIRQIHSVSQANPDSKFIIDGDEVSRLTFVATVRNISRQATNNTYQMDDGTGTIEVKLWVDGSDDSMMDTDDSKPHKQITEGSYVRVFGQMKAFNDRKHVGATLVRPVTDFNEVQYHMLEATLVHLYFTRGPPGGAAIKDEAFKTEDGGQTGEGSYVGQQIPRLSPVAARLFRAMRNEAACRDQGLPGVHIATLAGVQTGQSLTDAFQELVEGGMIYPSMDEDTFALSDPNC
ncbi:MAG: replication factor A protein 2 [Vezdaea aestivalis]|nr:MAG: replication factor A protein 2 [Vezdaea aestivalis]